MANNSVSSVPAGLLRTPIAEKNGSLTRAWARWLTQALYVFQALGFGNGAAGTAVTTTAKGTGTGPATPQTIVQYAPVNINGTVYYVPLMQ
jgi:hypothetical protein